MNTIIAIKITKRVLSLYITLKIIIIVYQFTMSIVLTYHLNLNNVVG